ncbi:MAG: cupin domain-containing protein, partial [Thermoleophilaceae bacterium]
MVELNHIATSSPAGRAQPVQAPSPRKRRFATVITVARLAPDEPLHPHVLDGDEDMCLAVVEGVVYAAVDEMDYVLTPGDHITIPAGDTRRVRNAGDEAARVVVERRPR